MLKTPVLELRDIELNIENFSLRKINIDLFENEIHVIMGENGSGKSLLMQLVSGLITPTSGDVLLEGDFITSKNYVSLSGKDIIYIRQDLEMLETLSVAENLFFHNLPYKNKFLKNVDFEKLDYMYSQLIKELDLPLTTNDTVSSIGLAQRQIIEFCKAYISDAKVVILDEPSAALTHNERELLYRIVRHIRHRGAGVFYITHCLEDVMAIGDRITVLKKGQIVGTKQVASCSEEEIIQMLSINYINSRYPKIFTKKGRTLLEAKHLGYSNKLYEVNFKLHEGEILGITGLAGSGRTLLANCLFGVTAYNGIIKLDGKEIHITSPGKAIECGIALLPEDRLTDSVFECMNTDENVAFPSFKRFSKYKVINQDDLRQAVLEYIHKINLPKGRVVNITDYSGGNLQKTIFAKWIMSRAKIFILDEPTRGVDIASKIDIYNFINDLVKKKVAIILISSDIEEIFGICDRVAVLAENTLACDLPIKATSIEEIVKIATKESSA